MANSTGNVFYDAAICIKAVYSQKAHCKDFLVRKFLSLIVFDFILEKSGSTLIAL